MPEITTKTRTVSMMAAQKDYVNNISKGLQDLLGKANNYQILCGFNILSQINLLLSKEGLNHTEKGRVDTESINNAIKFAMIYSLNTDNNEVFVMLRNDRRPDGSVLKKVECKPQYRGHLKILADFGRDVIQIYPEWIVREGDEFSYQTYKGIDVVPPTWTPKSQDGKVIRVVVPILKKSKQGNFVDYRIAERESVAKNIKAQISQALMFKKDEKERVMTLIRDYTLDDLLTDRTIAPYVNDTYTGISQEEMIITKLILNATKRVGIDFKNAVMREITEETYDNSETYKSNHNAKEIIDNNQTLIEVQGDVEEISTDSGKKLLPPVQDTLQEDLDDLFGE